MKRILKRIGLAVLVGLIGLGIWQHELLGYGYMQAKGQLHIMLNTRPVADMLANPSIPDSAKAKIRLIGEIKQFAEDSLGLDPSENFTTFHDQQGKPLMWMLVGADRYALKPVQYSIPLLGTFAYKGFFDRSRLLAADSLLRKEGYDTRISGVAAYSTLGFFKDPILSSMLMRTDGDLAQLIIHELTHGTLFIKNNLEYNENLADFVGDYGAGRFMAYKYGQTSAVYRDYVAGLLYWERYTQHVVRGSQLLDKTYGAFKPTTPVAVKDSVKWTTIKQIVSAADTITDGRSDHLPRKQAGSVRDLPNNAYFVGYLTYRKQQNRFKNEFVTQFNSDFPRYLRHLKQTYPSL